MLSKTRYLLWLVLLLIIAVLEKNSLLLLGLILFGGYLVIVFLWQRFCFAKLTIRRSLKEKCIFYGEETQYVVEVENSKIIPLLWLQLTDLVTKGITFANSQLISNKPGTPDNKFSDIFSLKWYEKVTRKYPIKPMRRGYFIFGRGEIRVAGFFGGQTQSLSDDQRVALLVYPKILPIEKLGFPETNPFGRHQVNHWIYQDPANRVGIRPYQVDDPFQQINWKASARQQVLQSNVLKPTMDKKLLIILNAKLMNQYWEGFNHQRFELAVVCAASLANYALDHGYQVGFLSNGIISKKTSLTKIFPKKSVDQREKILRALAMVEPFHHHDIDHIISREISKLEIGTTVVLVSNIVNSALVDSLRLLHKRGYQPLFLKIGQWENQYVKQLRKILVYTVEEGLWDEIKNIQFARESVR